FPKPGVRLQPADEHVLHWLAAKDQWHAITHAGEPGTELPRALGYVQVGGQWVMGRANPLLASTHAQVREIMMQPSGRLVTAEPRISHNAPSQGSSPRVEYVERPAPTVNRSSGGGGSANSWSSHPSAPAPSSVSWHESSSSHTSSSSSGSS